MIWNCVGMIAGMIVAAFAAALFLANVDSDE